jgi:ABC-type phosphate/phosphonate transport system ATPase subunit/ASC-1-like (ASCH) protein
MRGLTDEATAFLAQRVAMIAPTSEYSLPDLPALDMLGSAICLKDFTLTYHSQVRRTQQSHAVQQAFGISPDKIDTTVINELTLNIKPGQIALIIGPSGSGKTTLLDYLARSGHVPAQIEMETSGQFSVPTNYHPGIFEPIRSKKALIEILADRSVPEALRIMGLVGLSDAYVYLKRFDELSKGQQFRAMLAKLIATRTNVWLIDEFCANLDLATANVVADKLQRIARKCGATVIAAAPHCQYFLHSLKPDIVIQLTTAWDHTVIGGKSFMEQVKAQKGGASQPQSLRIRSEYLRAIRQGKKTSTIRKGKQSIKLGLLLLECGAECQVVNVTDVQWRQLKTLTHDHAIADGFPNREALITALKNIYPELDENRYITVITFTVFAAAPLEK